MPFRTHHAVRLYRRDETLVASVSEFLRHGLDQGESALVVATPAHRDAVEAALRGAGADVDALRSAGRYVALDAAKTLDRFLHEGQPDPARFAAVIGPVLDRLEGGCGVRAFGEMVDLLWQGGRPAAALRLEELWTRQLHVRRAALVCAYRVDPLEQEVRGDLDAICALHTRLVLVDDYAGLERAAERAFAEVAGAAAPTLRRLSQLSVHPWGGLRPAEQLVLWTRRNLPALGERFLEGIRRHLRSEGAADVSAASR